MRLLFTEATKRWRQKHPEGHKTAVLKWRQTNPEKHKLASRQRHQRYAASPQGRAVGRKKTAKYRAGRDAAADAFQRKLKRYGLTESVFWALLAKQDGVCAICKTSEWGRGASHPFIDHDHRCCAGDKSSCGKCVRGLLCMKCNAGLGLLKDDTEVVASALNYLKDASIT